jgi:transposase, IS30 family
MFASLRKQGFNKSQIARALGRHRSTVGRELRRNSTRADGRYRASTAQERANGRRSRSRRNRRFTAEDFAGVEELLCRQWSPEQVSGHLAREGRLSISHETIYRHVWRDKREGGSLYTHLRGARKRRRKRYGGHDSRGRLAGKRMISERPPEVETRQQAGHWEIDTVVGSGSKDCVLTLVERGDRAGAHRQAPGPHRRLLQPEGGPPHAPTRGGVRDGDGRQRDGAARLPEGRAADGRGLLLRPAVPLVGAREQRER